MEQPLFLSYKKATILKVKHKKKILSFPCLFFFLSCSALSRTSKLRRHAERVTRISRDPRNALRLSEDDRRKNNTVIAGLDPAIHKHKALAHDMHAESNALRQSFVPQPMLRSSWLQLARFNKGSYRSH